jgi:hypothetical protein
MNRNEGLCSEKRCFDFTAVFRTDMHSTQILAFSNEAIWQVGGWAVSGKSTKTNKVDLIKSTEVAFYFVCYRPV